MRVKDIKKIDPVAIGDNVSFKLGGDEEGRGMIEEVLPRSNSMSRLGAGRKPIEQVIVANIDQTVIVASVTYPKTSLFRLTGIWQMLKSQDSAVIIATKTDLLFY
ncbi:MAG: hypothetical protein R2883_05630 [Caldisericia bacterium]